MKGNDVRVSAYVCREEPHFLKNQMSGWQRPAGDDGDEQTTDFAVVVFVGWATSKAALVPGPLY